MIDKLAAHRFLAVVGTSGSGKSSLVNCGLRPALHRGRMASAGLAGALIGPSAPLNGISGRPRIWPAAAMSAPVSTHSTPVAARAASVSIDTIRPWARSARRNAARASPGRACGCMHGIAGWAGTTTAGR